MRLDKSRRTVGGEGFERTTTHTSSPMTAMSSLSLKSLIPAEAMAASSPEICVRSNCFWRVKGVEVGEELKFR